MAKVCFCLFHIIEDDQSHHSERRAQVQVNVLATRTFKSGGERSTQYTHRNKSKYTQTFLSEILRSYYNISIYASGQGITILLVFETTKLDSHQEMRIQRGGKMSHSDIESYVTFHEKFPN